MNALEVCPSVSRTTFISTPAANISDAAAMPQAVQPDVGRPAR
ncbi:hypothetical protein [Nonomuraea composti]|nr:hypothetical protein [Nonomuraea sp. FMUSA5-5]